MKKRINTETAQIDSFTLAIKTTKKIEVNYKYREPYIKVWEGGEHEEGNQQTKVVRDTESGKIAIGLKNMVRDGEVITITITAKILKEKYFEGITKENIKIVHNTIMELGEFKCTLKEFIKGKVYDIDICQNIYKEKETKFMDIIKPIKKITKEGLKVDLRNKEGHEALYFNNREKATANKPFGKIYNKEMELEKNSKEFQERYIKEWETKNLIRYEATIKNYEMKRNLENKKIMRQVKTLEELLEAPQKELKGFLKWSIEQYLKDNVKIEQKEEEDETLTEQQIKGLLKIIIEEGNIGSYEIIEKVTEYVTGKNEQVERNNKSKTRTRIKNLIETLGEENESIQEYLNGEKEAKRILQKIGVNLK